MWIVLFRSLQEISRTEGRRGSRRTARHAGASISGSFLPTAPRRLDLAAAVKFGHWLRSAPTGADVTTAKRGVIRGSDVSNNGSRAPFSVPFWIQKGTLWSSLAHCAKHLQVFSPTPSFYFCRQASRQNLPSLWLGGDSTIVI